MGSRRTEWFALLNPWPTGEEHKTPRQLLIGSALAKQAMLSPFFVPMLLLPGISPELAQAVFHRRFVHQHCYADNALSSAGCRVLSALREEHCNWDGDIADAALFTQVSGAVDGLPVPLLVVPGHYEYFVPVSATGMRNHTNLTRTFSHFFEDYSLLMINCESRLYCGDNSILPSTD